MIEPGRIKSVAIIGAGAAGAIAAAALSAEGCYDRIRVFERKRSPGGTWIYDPDPGPEPRLYPGALPPTTDPPLVIPKHLPTTAAPNTQERYDRTPIYDELTTNVPDIAMSFSDRRFSYGPFPPHWVPQQYIANYFSEHRTDKLLVLNTTVEDLSKVSSTRDKDGWRLVLRRYDAVKNVDVWWEEEFDAVIIANGHYSVPFNFQKIPQVEGLEDYLLRYPGRVVHSKVYRNAQRWENKKVLVIGNSASGHDVTTGLVGHATPPVYQSRRSVSRWDGDEPPAGIAWKPIISEYLPNGDIVFEGGSVLSDVDTIIYSTGYRISFPFWNAKANGGEIWDYDKNKLIGSYQHTFFSKYPTLGIIGVPRVLTFRSFEYQAIALARVYSGRGARGLPSSKEQKQWGDDRWDLVSREKRKFHDIMWDNGETMEWLRWLFELAGLPELEGRGRCPPVLNDETRWAIEHLRKYPEHQPQPRLGIEKEEDDDDEWEHISRSENRDSLYFI